MITELLTLQNQLRIFHWATESYAEHKALGKAYEELDDLIDTFIEVFQGKYARIKSKDGFDIKLENYSDNSAIISFVDKYVEYLVGMNGKLEGEYTDELLNIRDEIVATLQRLKYLLTLK
jgi:Family of unknown function (DUF5856)